VLGFTSVNIGGTRYDMKAEPVSQLADATKGEDATKIGVGAGAGARSGRSSAARKALRKVQPSAAAPARASCSPRKGTKYGSQPAPTSRHD
jgi:hypothetical protein